MKGCATIASGHQSREMSAYLSAFSGFCCKSRRGETVELKYATIESVGMDL